MRIALVVLCLVLMALCGVASAQPQDVPQDHWAYDAVAELAERGLVLGYPDGKFLGDRVITRYEMASIVARILAVIDESTGTQVAVPGTRAQTEPQARGPVVTKEDIDKVKKLTEEFKVELTVMGTRLDKIEQQLSGVENLKPRLAEVEKKLDESQKAQEALKKTQGASTPTVTAASKGSNVKIDARIFTGVFNSEDDGSYDNWSTDIKDAKLRFTYSPSKDITVVNRFSISGAKNGDFDYFYLDYKNAPGSNNVLRVGQRKIDFGQETFVDNPVENMLISTAVSSVAGYGTGIALLGKVGNAKTSPLYEVGFVNGPKGTMLRTTNGLPVNVKLGIPLGNLFASASYFNSGDMLPADKSALSVGGLTSAPTGVTGWERTLWEADLRYNYGPNGIRALIPTGDLPPIMLGATYGVFDDDATGAADRNGSYWFVEGLVRLSRKAYAATRYSVVDLDNGVLAKLGGNPVNVNSYKRTSIGLGYALTNLTHLKAEYSINDTSGGPSDPSLNQWAVGFASKF